MVDRFYRDPEMLYCLARSLGPAATSPGPRKEDVALIKDNCATIPGGDSIFITETLRVELLRRRVVFETCTRESREALGGNVLLRQSMTA